MDDEAGPPTAAPAPRAAAAPDTEPVDDLVTTRHTLRTTRGSLPYTATAGRLVLRREEHTDGAFGGHSPTAEVFVVAYTAGRAHDLRPRTVPAGPVGRPGPFVGPAAARYQQRTQL